MTTRMILVGTGGQGAAWCEHFLPPHVADGRLEVVAAADVDEGALENAREHLDLTDRRLFTDPAEAFAAVEADSCAIVVPPFHHEEIVELAVEHDCHVLSEKPIANTLVGAARIAERIDRAGLKMGVTMSHRFDRDKTSLRRELESGDHGPVDYLVGRFTCALRNYGDWGAFRHDMDQPLLIEGAVHQLDFLADMAGGAVRELYADTWQPEWAEYAGDCQALVQFRTDTGARVQWEGAKANASSLNCWGHDYVRAECRDATLELDDRTLRCYDLGADEPRDIELADGDRWANTLLVEQFLNWVEGGEPMATRVEENLESVALVEAAITASEQGEPVDVATLLSEMRESVCNEGLN